MSSSQGWWNSMGSPSNWLNSQRKTKISIKGKSYSGRYQSYTLHFKSHSLQSLHGILGKLAEAGKGWEFLSKSALPDICGVPLRQEGKISCSSLLSKIRLSVKNKQQQQQKTYWLLIPSLPRISIGVCFFHFVSREFDLAMGSLGAPGIWPDRNVGCTLSVARVLPNVASSQGNCLRSSS